MENWGLITFRESAMLYEEGVSARINKQRVATIICHELAHQWFGNLVTPGRNNLQNNHFNNNNNLCFRLVGLAMVERGFRQLYGICWS